MASSDEFQQNPFSLLDALYCEEEKLEDDEANNDDDEEWDKTNNGGCLLPLLLLEQDLFWEDEEIRSLFSKEEEEKKQGIIFSNENGGFDVKTLSSSRNEVVELILKVNSYYGFCTLTSVLAVNYLDRFLSSFCFQKDKPWMFQLTAVTCLSLAAKVEETHVPLLLDLQVLVKGGNYVFDAKTIQKMELLVLSTLDWKMNPVTPLSFLDHIIRRLGLKNHLHWEFLRRCQGLLLSLLSDWRFVSYLPSVLATATMMHVIDQIEPCNPLDYQNQLLGVLNISKDKVNDCYQLIVEKSLCGSKTEDNRKVKRTFDEMMTAKNNYPPPPPPPGPQQPTSSSDVIPSSPSGVMDAYYLSCDSSNDSWAATTTQMMGTSSTSSVSLSSSSLSSSVSSSPVMSRKKSRVHEQLMPLQLPSLSRVFVDVVGSPR
ncbi:cyclin-D3-1-like [Chenopodium quinoa]|uniref:B-like cyclin n=1 Tax=Chenopodium quinoa TaxID=63459 RepID=A0A803LH04_CHEQI|nr:cyclin-D3-1-like [Chenopodium quinoa]